MRFKYLSHFKACAKGTILHPATLGKENRVIRPPSRQRALLGHGGDLGEAARLFPQAPLPWIDLSTGLNPHPYPIGALPPDCLVRLPQETALQALTRAAARAYGAASATESIAVAGAQMAIELAPRCFNTHFCRNAPLNQRMRVGILSPTYTEHASVWRRAGAEVVETGNVDELARCDLGVIVNPNNPDGRFTDRTHLLALARKTRLIVDESFMDFYPPTASLIPVLHQTNAVVLRSFGKAYGLGGVRLGFILTASGLADALRQEIGLWSVSGPAIVLGQQALTDDGWREKMREQLEEDCRRLDALCLRAGLTIAGGTPLFRYIWSENAQDWFHHFGEAGVYVRRFIDRPHFLRLGLPPAQAWARLNALLRAPC